MNKDELPMNKKGYVGKLSGVTLVPNSDIRKHFEANILDGDSVDDCGGAMFSAKSVLEYLDEYMPEFVAAQQLALLDRLEKQKIGTMNNFGTHWGVPLTAIQSERIRIGGGNNG